MVSWEEFKATSPKFFNVHIDAVMTLARSVRNGMPCKVSDEFAHGIDNVAFKVEFEDEVEWICRVHGEEENVSTTYTTAKLNSAVATMRYIKANSSIPVPTIYAHESQNTTPGLGSGYIMMEFTPGNEIDGSPDSLSVEDETQVYLQLALVVSKLWQLRFRQIGPIYETPSGEFYVGPFVDEQGESFGPFHASVDFFKFKVVGIRNRYKEWLQTCHHLSNVDKEKACSVISLYEKIASQLSDHDYGSFPLAHGDLGTHNIRFVRDSMGQLQLSGVLDWDAAHASAWPDFGQYPALMEIEWPAFETGEYAPFVLNHILKKQRIFCDGLRQYEDAHSCHPGPPLSDLVDSAVVRVAEFILIYSDPEEYGVDCSLLLKYVRVWKKDWSYDPLESKSISI
jgi:aminoglycoside phosphotransferase (APT) family kinase protein